MSPDSRIFFASLRQRNELALVARHDVEAALLPFGLGLLDALLARGDEIPPDVTRPVHRGAADEDDARVGRSRDRETVARAEDQELAGREAVTGDLDFA